MICENGNEIEDINIIDTPDSPIACEKILPTSSVNTKITLKQKKQKLSIFQENLLNVTEKN